MKTNKKVFLIAGHSNNDPGAVSTVREADLTKELRTLIHGNLLRFNPGLKIITDNDNDSLSSVISKINESIEENDILIDIHFNSVSSPKATGSEVLIKDLSNPNLVSKASRISLLITKTLDISDRGVKTEKDSARGKIGILHGKGERLLIEVFFISNPEDLRKYQVNKHILASSIAENIEHMLSY